MVKQPRSFIYNKVCNIFAKIIRIVTCQRIATQRLDKHPEIRAHNNRTNVHSSLLENSQRTNGLARELSRDLFSVWSAPCQVLSNRTINTSTISVLYGVRPKVYKGK
jgi:hypothetical protein